VGLAAPVAERLGLPTAEAGDLLEKVFQQPEYPANVDPAILSKAKQTAGVYCDTLFELAGKSGYQLGHKGSQPTVKQTLGYANLWRTLKALDNSTPPPASG